MANKSSGDSAKSSSRPSRQALFQPPQKSLRRGYELVSPTSTDPPLSLAGIRVLFEEYLDPVKKELDSIQKSLQDATTKLGKVSDLEKACSGLKADNQILKSKLDKAEDKSHLLEERLISLESVSRRNNLKFILMKKGNLTSWPHKDCESIVLEMCDKWNLDLPKNCIERAYKLRGRQSDSPIIVKFLSFKDKLQVIRQKHRFRECGILVVEDFPMEVAQRRRLFAPVLTAAYKSGHKAHLSMDKLILDSKSYTVSDLDKLPQELQPNNLYTTTKGSTTAFYTLHSKLSNHHPCSFDVDGTTFKSVEQYFMFKKAALFGDNVTAQQVLKTSDPSVAKSLGKKIHNFDMDIWRNSRDEYMRKAIHAKFSQDSSNLANFLIQTGDATLVEANPHDSYWGAGLSLTDDKLWDPSKWKGSNILGRMLCELREKIKHN